MCTIFAKKTPSGVLVGRNFDWLQLGGTIHYIPPQRMYGSQTKGLLLIEQMGIDMPYEGINDSGLFMGCAVTPIDLNPPLSNRDDTLKINELGAIRFVLERATTTQEAVRLLDTISIRNSYLELFIRLHFLIADAEGNIAFYQSGDKTIFKSLTNGEGDVITNFPRQLSISNCWRYNTVCQNINTVTSMETAMTLLGQIHQEEYTVWSAVFHLSLLELCLCIEIDYATTHQFSLLSELKKGYSCIDFGTLKLTKSELRQQFSCHDYKQ